MDLSVIVTPPEGWSRAERTAWSPFAALTLVPFLARGRAEEHAEALENLAALDRFARVVEGCRACMELLGDAADEPRHEATQETCAELVRAAADAMNGATPSSVVRAAVALVMHSDPFSVAEMVCEDEHAGEYAARLRMFCGEARRLLGEE